MNNEKLQTLQESILKWRTLLEEKCIDTAPGQAIDIEFLIFSKKDFIDAFRPYRDNVDGYALFS